MRSFRVCGTFFLGYVFLRARFPQGNRGIGSMHGIPKSKKGATRKLNGFAAGMSERNLNRIIIQSVTKKKAFSILCVFQQLLRLHIAQKTQHRIGMT